MKVLVVNDDGINSPGLKAAVEALQDIAEVVVCAPAVQQSGVGRSISLFTPVSISRVDYFDCEAYAVSGTPVDCVIVGIYGILKEKPDVVVSGINIGENLSFEATTSGTIGAALEAANQGIPAVAISLHAEEKAKFEHFQPDQEFSLAKRVLRILTKEIATKGLPPGVDLLNVNVPQGNRARVKVTRLARRMYTTKVQQRFDPRGRVYFWIDGDAITEAPPGTDVHAVRVEKCISITPMRLDMTAQNHENLRELVELLEKRI